MIDATPREIAQLIRRLKADAKRTTPPVTFLIGSGFSRSAGILTGSEIVEKKLRPLLPDAPPPPVGRSEYAHLMSLLTPGERAGVIKDCIDEAKDPATKALTINWAHLLLTSMVSAGYVNLILTTNFDPLVVDALAITGLPIRAYDLTAGGAYLAGTLDPGSVIYLHGQSHAPFLANVNEETERVRQHLPMVFSDAIRDSMLIVAGYSGDCDPVLQELRMQFRQFRNGFFWVHRDASKPLGEEARLLLENALCEAKVLKGWDADRFMDELVIKELGLDLPHMIMDPLGSLARSLGRIAPLPPQEGAPASDPVTTARNYVQRAVGLAEAPSNSQPADKSAKKIPAKPLVEEGFFDVITSEGAPLEMRVSMAALVGDGKELDKLRPLVLAAKDEAFQRKLGDGYLRAAGRALVLNQTDQLSELLQCAEDLGVNDLHWLAALWGSALAAQARRKQSDQADSLWQQACAKYSEAVTIKPNLNDAWYNWGNALGEQARHKQGDQADSLWQQACAKYSEAVRIKPSMHDAWNNWGGALAEQARRKQGDQADSLWQQACAKYSEAITIKPDYHGAWNNWGNALYEQARCKQGDEADALWQQAFAKYSEALRIKPDSYEAWKNWGIALDAQARRKQGDEADALWQEAFAKYSQAVRIKPDLPEAWSNWGGGLDVQARRKQGYEADALWQEAFAKYSQAVRIKPDMHEAWANWGASLINQASRTIGNKQQLLFQEAEEKCHHALALNPSYPPALFYLACAAGLKGDASEAVNRLRQWLPFFEGDPLEELNQEGDFDGIRQTPEFQAFMVELAKAKSSPEGMRRRPPRHSVAPRLLPGSGPSSAR